MPANVYDKASRFTFKLDPAAHFAWWLRVPSLSHYRDWLDTRAVPFPGDPDRSGDTVARFDQSDGQPWAIAVEFQTEPDPLMFSRLLGYFSNLWSALKPDDGRGSRYQLGAVVVNLTGIGHSSRDMSWPEFGFVTRVTAVERNLARESADELLGEITTGSRPRVLLPWIPLMQGADQSDRVTRWKELAAGEPDTFRRSEYGGLALVFAEAAGRHELWGKALEGWNMRQSTVVEGWRDEGRVEGRVEGRAEGRAEGEARMVLTMLEARYGPVSPDMAAVIRGTTDAERLQQFGRAAGRAASLEEFRALAGM